MSAVMTVTAARVLSFDRSRRLKQDSSSFQATRFFFAWFSMNAVQSSAMVLCERSWSDSSCGSSFAATFPR